MEVNVQNLSPSHTYPKNLFGIYCGSIENTRFANSSYSNISSQFELRGHESFFDHVEN